VLENILNPIRRSSKLIQRNADFSEVISYDDVFTPLYNSLYVESVDRTGVIVLVGAKAGVQ